MNCTEVVVKSLRKNKIVIGVVIRIVKIDAQTVKHSMLLGDNGVKEVFVLVLERVS